MSTSEPAQRTAPGDEENGEIEADWQQFQRLEQMANHWDRPGWTDTRRSYHWMITLGAEPDVRNLAAAGQAEFTDITALDPVPLDYLHVTLQGVGFTDEVDRTTIDQLVTTVQDRSAVLEAFDITIGPLTGSSGAVRLAVSPYAPLRAVQTMIRTAAAETPGIPTSRTRPKPFTPHASIAYSNTPSPAEPTIDRVRQHRAARPVTIRIGSAQLVELRRENRQYRWSLLATALFATHTRFEASAT